MARDVIHQVRHLQENPIAKGRELEFTLLGPGIAPKYDPEQRHDGEAEKNIRDIRVASAIVKNQINKLEAKAEKAEEDERDFKYADITTHPENPYVYGLYTELCRLLDYEDLSTKQIRYYNTLETVLDLRFGTDFLLEIDPAVLPEKKFGKEIKKVREKMDITLDLTSNPSKSVHKADRVIQHEHLAESTEELTLWGREDARKVVETLIEKLKSRLGTNYKPPMTDEIAELEASEKSKNAPKRTVETVRSGVVRRVKNVNPDV